MIQMKYTRPSLILLVMFLPLNGTATQAQGTRAVGATNRANALRTLKGCSTRPVTLGCSEDTAQYLIGLYDHGDQALLTPLLDAGMASDGALSESLGNFYAKVLWKASRTFLAALYVRPLAEQRHLSRMAGATDGSGMPPKVLHDVRRTLCETSSQRGWLSSVARICLAEVNRANASEKRL